MSRCDKILEQAEESNTSLAFSDLCYLAECWGYEESRQRGSHAIYKHAELKLPKEHAIQNFQDYNGDAKSSQVDQLLDAIRYIAENHAEF